MPLRHPSGRRLSRRQTGRPMRRAVRPSSSSPWSSRSSWSSCSAIIEFAFALNAILAIDFASRDAALAAAEAGATDGADCSILRSLDQSVTAPAYNSNITEVRIFKSDSNGQSLGPVNVYDRSGSAACAGLGYHQVSEGYADTDRCNELAGLQGPEHASTRSASRSPTTTTGTRRSTRSISQSGGGYTMVKSNAMRMEPIL